VTPFVERLVYQAVHDGVAEYAAEPAAFETFLLAGGLTAEEAAKGRQYITDRPPTVIMGYPRRDAQIPCMALTVGSESVAADWLDEGVSDLDEDGARYLDEDGNATDMHGRRWQHNFDLYVYADNGDACAWYYQLAKFVAMRARTTWQAQDLDEITLSGAELAPDPRLSPSDIFVRRLSIACRSDAVYTLPLRGGAGPGNKITGLHVAQDGTNDAAAEALVTPYNG
jgi:hypothetical protein